MIERAKMLTMFLCIPWLLLRLNHGGIAVCVFGAVTCFSWISLIIVKAYPSLPRLFPALCLAIGSVMNFSVMLANGGHMPALGPARGIWLHATPGVKLYLLADIHRGWFGWYSLGDTFVFWGVVYSFALLITAGFRAILQNKEKKP